jgi:uncharacterized protein
MTEFAAILDNKILWIALICWLLAQVVKVPLDYLRTRRFNWILLLRAGGMPSSHSALITSIAHGVGLSSGFDSPIFALALVITAIVVYDATGVRRQAGIHAQKINVMIDELLQGHPVSEKQLLEVLGHTPLEAAGGIFWAVAVTQILWYVWN